MSIKQRGGIDMDEILKEIQEILETLNGIDRCKVRAYARVLAKLEAEKQ